MSYFNPRLHVDYLDEAYACDSEPLNNDTEAFQYVQKIVDQIDSLLEGGRENNPEHERERTDQFNDSPCQPFLSVEFTHNILMALRDEPFVEIELR